MKDTLSTTFSAQIDMEPYVDMEWRKVQRLTQPRLTSNTANSTVKCIDTNLM